MHQRNGGLVGHVRQESFDIPEATPIVEKQILTGNAGLFDLVSIRLILNPRPQLIETRASIVYCLRTVLA